MFILVDCININIQYLFSQIFRLDLKYVMIYRASPIHFLKIFKILIMQLHLVYFLIRLSFRPSILKGSISLLTELFTSFNHILYHLFVIKAKIPFL